VADIAPSKLMKPTFSLRLPSKSQMDSLILDVKYAVRSILTAPKFAAVLLTLAVTSRRTATARLKKQEA
jgi:hypothetical protein